MHSASALRLWVLRLELWLDGRSVSIACSVDSTWLASASVEAKGSFCAAMTLLFLSCHESSESSNEHAPIGELGSVE